MKLLPILPDLKTCLIIINYNGARFFPSYLENLAVCCKENNIPLFVTDDQSLDNSIEYLVSGGYTFTQNNTSRHGFAANVNNGIRFALTRDAFDYLIISNNDIAIANEFFPAMLTAVHHIQQKQPSPGLIGFSEMFPYDEKTFNGFQYNGYKPGDTIQTTTIPGCFFIICKKLLDVIGYMDEDYFMYGEDNDYFIRAIKAGFGIYNTGLPVMHYSEGSSSDSKKTSWYVYRNAFLYAQKNLGAIGVLKMFMSFVNQVYNPFYTAKNPGNIRVTRHGFFYNNYLLIKSILWNTRYFLKTRLVGK